MKRIFSALMILSSLSATSAIAECSESSVQIRGTFGQARFHVEVADDVQERAQGLMNRQSMSASAGMLFVFEESAPVSFWMENTLIPLDMLFIDDSGTIVHVHHNAIPLDRTPISSTVPVRYVLEIKGGMAKAMGISTGSQLRHPMILKNYAIWPCEG
ncbi:DUF192 domain-containing protein [Shimia litoralis]|nr:DUF192 domain-containing protein [Shimia litoralis]